MTLLFSENFLKTYVRPLWAAWAAASAIVVVTTSDDGPIAVFARSSNDCAASTDIVGHRRTSSRMRATSAAHIRCARCFAGSKTGYRRLRAAVS